MSRITVITVPGGVAALLPSGRWRWYCWHCGCRFNPNVGPAAAVGRVAATHVNTDCEALSWLPF